MTVIYPVIFTETNDKDNVVLVEIPDIQGMTEGYGLSDAIGMAKEYIGNALCMKPDSEFPKPSRIGDIDISKGNFADEGTSFVSLVDVDIEAYRRFERSKNVRRNITLPEWLDEMAAKARINVSAIAQKALKKELGIAV